MYVTRWDDAKTFISKVPSQFRDNDAFISLQIKYSMAVEDFQTAKSLLSKNCFPTYAKVRGELMTLWNSVTEGIAQQEKNAKEGTEKSLTILEKHQARMKNPIPENIGCQYATDYCLNYW
jgi:hypothetical protein